MTKYRKVLAYIERSKSRGRSYGEIQRFIVESLNGKDYDEMEELWRYTPDNVREVYGQKRRWRGYWADHLCGNWRKAGLLYRYCHKNDKGRWVYGSPRP